MTGALVKAADSGQKAADSALAELTSLLSRLLGPAADVIGEDWADRLRRKNVERLLRKTEKHAASKSDAGWAQPRVVRAVVEAAEYANDEIVTDYLSGVLASSRAPGGGSDDALPWSSLVARLSALQLRVHYIAYLNIRRVLQASDGITRIFEFDSNQIALPFISFVEAVGLDPEERDYARLADALHGLQRENLISAFSYGDRDFHSGMAEKQRIKFMSIPVPTRRLETPFDPVILLTFTPFGIRFFLWGLGLGACDDGDYLDPGLRLQLDDPSGLITGPDIEGVDFAESFWVEYDKEGNAVTR